MSEQESAERTKEVKFYVLKLVAEMLLTSEQLMVRKSSMKLLWEETTFVVHEKASTAFVLTLL